MGVLISLLTFCVCASGTLTRLLIIHSREIILLLPSSNSGLIPDNHNEEVESDGGDEVAWPQRLSDQQLHHEKSKKV